MEFENVNLVIGGEAGQGLVTIGQILAKSLVRRGYNIVVTQSYQSRIRGGHNTYNIRVSTEDIKAPQESVDLLIALNAETVDRHRSELSAQGMIIADARLDIADDKCIKVPFAELADKKFYNVVALGIAGAVLGFDGRIITQTLETFFGKKDPEVAQKNEQALSESYRWATENDAFGRLTLAPCADPLPRLVLNGNEAIALGAMSAGVKFCSFYPMTPATSILLNLIAAAEQMGLVVEQAEDEIAAVNMALGASFAGAPSLVATSGGGFALMVEGVSLAAMTETPLVIIVAQRPGPATGLPTRTEQGDLEFVLHAGHGEFPRAIFTPGTVESCFHLTRRALELAERVQGPIFLLTDQYLADSARAVLPFDLKNLAPVTPVGTAAPPVLPYQRYALTDNGVSPRLLPGLSEHLVVADSDEHTSDGHITEDLQVRIQMVDKRWRKLEDLRSAVIPPEYQGDAQPDLLLVTWGSSQGPVLEAAAALRKDGQHVATLCFSQVWPLVEEQFLNHLQEAKQVVSVEGNASGQLARLVRRETGFLIPRQVRRYDGLPLTSEYILRALTQ
ncbi:MAG: 2-oxoacid:acceptor oxidoreductase subunit alpha [Desulfobacca sp.]|nr:2-oxoacid:acceptor oxidoreductase subunit alpha [Desulfobacca sp.]